MRSRPFEASFLCGAALAAICALAIFSALESSRPGAFLCLLAGGYFGYGYRASKASDHIPEVSASRWEKRA